MPSPELRDEFSRLYAIIKKLRSEGGCPWDKRQTPASIKKYLLEETAELAEAIDHESAPHIREEIGDLFYILILLIRIHEEKGEFSAAEVLASISQKMIRRHPHVFAGAMAGTDSELRAQWARIKAMEKNSRE
ncbi:MAG TPA: nucleotide pyrophosphohydrolase [Desulfobulbaceae bacterium]|nr:nucleotide pyrophosphohydrolase [Desulfobulbaceae bacterium]